MKGCTLHLALDTLGLTLEDMQPKILRIGRGTKGGINNPRLPADPHEIDLMFASWFGTGLSDGHIERGNRGFVYSEKNRDRVDIVIADIIRIGDGHYKESLNENGVWTVRFSSVFGRMLEARGFPTGDKAMQHVGLPEFILNGHPEVVSAYVRQMFCEDGSFSTGYSGTRGVFSVTRGTTLYDPSKTEYAPLSNITEQHISLIKTLGHKSEEGLVGPNWELTGGKLKRLAAQPESPKSLIELQHLVSNSIPSLLEDERRCLHSVGIKAKPYLAKVVFFPGSGRVSAKWMMRTLSLKDTMSVLLFAPPDDVVKKTRVREWVLKRPDIAGPVTEGLKRRGLPCYYEDFVGDES